MNSKEREAFDEAVAVDTSIPDVQYFAIVDDWLRSNQVSLDFWIDHLSVGRFHGYVEDDAEFDLRELVREFVSTYDRHEMEDRGQHVMRLLAAAEIFRECHDMC